MGGGSCNIMGAFSAGGGAGGATPFFMIATWCEGASSNTNVFNPIWSNLTHINSSTESDMDVAINTDFTVIRNQALLTTNTKNASNTFAFRDDGSSVGALTITASTTGEFDSGAISVAVSSGSLCCFNRDSSGASSGTHRFIEFVSCNPT
jgi:hypothetical protein